MRDNITRVRSIGVIGETTPERYVSYVNDEGELIRSSPIEKTILKIMEECGIDVPLINIYRYDGEPSEYRSRIEESLSTLDKANCIIISEAYAHPDELNNLGSKIIMEDEDRIAKILNRDCAIFKSLGFIDISFYMDEYEYGIPFMYRNELSEKLYDYMHYQKLDKNLYGLNILFRLNMKDPDHIDISYRCIGEDESEEFYSKELKEVTVNSSCTTLLEDNEHVSLNMKYERIVDMQTRSSSMIPASRTRKDLSITDINPGTMTLYVEDKLAHNQITNTILLDICDTSIQVHWRRYTELSEHTVASTQFSVANIVKCDLYWKESGIFNLVFSIPDPKTITKPIFTYLLPEDTDFADVDLWQTRYLKDMLSKAIYQSQGIYCETLVDETMMKKYTFRDMLTGEITHEESKSLRGENNVQSDEG